ncbi:MAG TPA: diguanylate cyclase [Verrucomicrobiae bacterium]|nr:diguanylate cyclase [Verrucomicrobiae bacterium]
MGQALILTTKSRIFRTGIICACFFAIYLLLNRPEVIFITDLGFTAWYPAAGLSVATMLGLSPWYGVLLLVTDPIVGRLMYGVPLLSWPGFLGSCGPASFYALSAYLLRGPWKIDVSLRRRQDVMRYFAVCVVAAAGSTSVGVISLLLSHDLSIGQYWRSWISWYDGEIIGVVGIAPFLLIHVLPSIRRFLGIAQGSEETEAKRGTPREKPFVMTRTLEFLAQMFSIPAAQFVVLRFEAGHMLFLLFLPILWIAMRQGVRRVVTGNVALIMGMVAGIRIFSIPQSSLFSISLSLLFMSAAGLIVGAMVSEEFRQARDLRNQTVYLNSLVENNPLPIVFLELDRKMRMCNEAFLRMYQFTREDLTATTVDKLIWPPEFAEQGDKMFADVVNGQTVHVPTRRRRKDGEILDVELIAVPLIVDSRPRGVCWIYSDISGQLRAAQEAHRHAEELAEMVQELKIHNTEMGLLSELNSLLQCCATSQEAYTAVGQSAKKLFPAATSGALYVLGADKKTLEKAAEWGAATVSDPAFEPSLCWGFRRGQAHWSDHPGGGVVCGHLKDPVEASYLCVPMISGNKTAGVLHLQIDRGEREREMPGFESMMQGMERLAVTASGQIALAMASLRLKEELQSLSIRDPLTGLFNRRVLEESLQREIKRAHRKGQHVSLVFIDLDHFKQFNDTFGHAAGDEVLIRMAHLFQSYYRSEDVVCRFGGEEFAVILPEAQPGDAVARAEGLREEAGKLVIRHEGRELGRVTLSIGIAAFPDHAAAPEELLRAADESLYRSKTTGRNRVSLAESMANASPAPSGVKQLI